MRFHKNRDILMDKHLSIYSRLKFFQAVITPTILFGLTSCAMTKSQICSLDVVQRRMFRNIVGWVRHDGEPWDETMRRMRSKVEAGLKRYPIKIGALSYPAGNFDELIVWGIWSIHGLLEYANGIFPHRSLEQNDLQEDLL